MCIWPNFQILLSYSNYGFLIGRRNSSVGNASDLVTHCWAAHHCVGGSNPDACERSLASHAVYTLIQCTPLLVEMTGVAPVVTIRITACKQERVQVRYPLWIWNPWGRTHEVQNRSNQWLHKMDLGPNKKITVFFILLFLLSLSFTVKFSCADFSVLMLAVSFAGNNWLLYFILVYSSSLAFNLIYNTVSVACLQTLPLLQYISIAWRSRQGIFYTQTQENLLMSFSPNQVPFVPFGTNIFHRSNPLQQLIMSASYISLQLYVESGVPLPRWSMRVRRTQLSDHLRGTRTHHSFIPVPLKFILGKEN